MSLAQGKEKEREFASMFNNVSFANKTQDIKEHWDVSVTYDVKSLKRINRKGVPDENVHWIEFVNVRGGTGWLYGKADFFAFETLDYWVIVSRSKLQEFIEAKCKNKEWTNTKELYKLYRREGRKDIITLVKTIDLMCIASKIICK